MWFYVVVNAMWAVLPIVLVVLAVLRVSTKELAGFLHRYGIRATAETAPTLLRLIVRNRASRFIGAAIGLSLVPLAHVLGPPIPSQGFLFGVSGYLAGAFVAALVPIQPTTTKRRASLVPRRLADYLPRLVRVAPAICVALSVVATIVYVLEPRKPLFGADSSPALALAWTVVAAAATVIAGRIVVIRRQPLGTQDLVAIDDAVRTQALHTLTGTGLAFTLFGTGGCLVDVGNVAANPLLHTFGWVGGLVALAAAVAALGFCWQPWRVRRAALS